MCKVQGSTDLKNGSCFNKHYFKTIEDKINWGGVAVRCSWHGQREETLSLMTYLQLNLGKVGHRRHAGNLMCDITL